MVKKIIIALFTVIFSILPGYSQMSKYDEEGGLSLFRTKSYTYALPILKRAAKAGSLPALDALGQMYQNGWGVEPNTTNMMNMYSKAIARNYVPSMLHLAEYYLNRNEKAKAINLLEKADNLGSVEACCGLSKIYEESDKPKALEYFYKCCKRRISLGDYKALNELGLYYMAKEDYVNARITFMEARDRKVLDNDSKRYLAEIFALGLGTEKSLDLAYALMNELKNDNEYYDEELYKEIDKEVNKIVVPKYPGGSEALYSFIRKNAKKPNIAIPSAGNGNAIVEFTITPTGNVTNLQYKKRVIVRVDEEVMRIARLLNGWTPATKGGKPVNIVAQLSMSFYPAYNAEIKFLRVK